MLSSEPLATALADHSALSLAQILKSDGKDIVKKGSSRKKTYLLVFHGWISLARKGKLGVLTDLDTKNPMLAIEFPEEKRKVVLRGTIVFPRTK